MRARHALLASCYSLWVGWHSVFGQALPPNLLPTLPVLPPTVTKARTNFAIFRTNFSVFPNATLPPAVVAPTTASFPSARPTTGTVSPDALKFDAKEKVANVKVGETEAKFVFAVTNVSKQEIVVMSVHTSCGCTAARLPSIPWVLKPGDGGEIGATMSLAGKYGTVTKTVTVVSSAGSIPLLVKAVLPPEAFQNVQRLTERSRNMQIAGADRQAVFRGDCARCHVETARGKKGHDLYTAACGVCHDAEHRATMVPALRGRTATFNREYWTQWVRNGKEGSLMPAFDSKNGGPLTDEQIESLTGYMAGDFAQEPAPVPVTTPQPGVTPASATSPTVRPIVPPAPPKL